MREWLIGISIGILLAACTPARQEPALTPTPRMALEPTSTPSLPDPTPTRTDPCVSGECLPTGDLPGWKQIFTDDFAGTVQRGDWSACSLTPLECKGLPTPYRAKWWAYTEGWPDTSK